MNPLSHLRLVPDTGDGPLATLEPIEPELSERDQYIQRAIRLLSLAQDNGRDAKAIRTLVVEAVSVLNVKVIPVLNTIITAENFAANNVAKVKKIDITESP